MDNEKHYVREGDTLLAAVRVMSWVKVEKKYAVKSNLRLEPQGKCHAPLVLSYGAVNDRR